MACLEPDFRCGGWYVGGSLIFRGISEVYEVECAANQSVVSLVHFDAVQFALIIAFSS